MLLFLLQLFFATCRLSFLFSCPVFPVWDPSWASFPSTSSLDSLFHQTTLSLQPLMIQPCPVKKSPTMTPSNLLAFLLLHSIQALLKKLSWPWVWTHLHLWYTASQHPQGFSEIYLLALDQLSCSEIYSLSQNWLFSSTLPHTDSPHVISSSTSKGKY